MRTGKVVVGSGWWCDATPHVWSIGSPATQSASFFDLWYRQVLLCLQPDHIIITDSASPIKPNFTAYDLIQWVELDRNYGHANDIRTGRIHTKYSGFTRSVINGAMYALCCDADFYVYVEQDCLLHGENFLMEAVGDSTSEILLGAPPQNGRGLHGVVAAAMLQQSLIIVRRSGLERFLIGLLGSPVSDGDVSPEETMRTRLAPFDFLRVPYGRSRPIDFECAHFYAQHLDDEEFANFRQKFGTADAGVPSKGSASVPSEVSNSASIPHDLRRELREWERHGQKARFWLRDDDAFTDTPHLRRLLSLAEDIGTVFALAVIPERADGSLARLVASAPFCVWQHGWRHHWQLNDGEQTYSQGEFGPGRDLESMMLEARNGQFALDRIFGGAGWQRVFVPPFHALSTPFKMILPSLGYWGLSAGHPLTPPLDTLTEVNTEIDIMDWPQRKFCGTDVVAKLLVRQLQSRRLGQVPADAPIGLLTHHLAHDDEAWQFLTDVLRFLKSNCAAEFLRADTLFEQPQAKPSKAPHGELRAGIEPDRITVIVTSCGRQDLLETTLDSFLRYNTYPITEFIVIEDGDGAKNKVLMEKYREHPFRWLATGEKVGQVAAIDLAYNAVRTEFIFHCEDDWEFTAPGFIEKSLTIMAHNPSILQVWLRALNDTNRHPLVDYALTVGDLPYCLVRHHHSAEDWGTWHGFSWNPGLRRRRDYCLLGSFSSLDPGTTRETWQVESDASAFYQKRGFYAAILADNDGNGYVHHIGGGRRVPRDYIVQRAARTAGQVSRLTLVEQASPASNRRCESMSAARDRHAATLMARLAAQQRFACVPQTCARERDAGISDLPNWRIWTKRRTTAGQLRIEELLEGLVGPSSSILHIGVGNSSLGRRFAPRVSRVIGSTIYDEERILAESIGAANYAVVIANKFTDKMDRVEGPFDFIVDPNPSGFACCLFHFSRMLITYSELLRKDGGILLTEQRGLAWVCEGNHPDWSLGWEDWVSLGEILHMPARRETESVYSMRYLAGTGIPERELTGLKLQAGL